MAGRPKQLNRPQLMAIAVEHFWRHGYQTTSLRQVATAAGLTTGALYNEFKDKDALFLAALEHYMAYVIQPRIDHILMASTVTFIQAPQLDSPAERIRYFLSSSVIGLPDSVAHQACLLVNSKIEFHKQTDSPILRAVNQSMKRIEQGLIHQLAIAEKHDQLLLDIPSALAQIQIFMTGLLLTAKSAQNLAPLQTAIDHFINHLFKPQQ